MKKPQGILLDVDKTITRSDRTISSRTIQAIQNVIQSGIKVGLCTGRQYAFLAKKVLPIFPPESVHIAGGGGQIIKNDGTVLVARSIDHNEVKKILQLANQENIRFVTCSNNTVFVNQDKALEKIKTDPWIQHAELFPDDFQNLIFFLLNVNPLTPSMQKLLNKLEKKQLITQKLMYDYAGIPNADITAHGVTKATAACDWAHFYHLGLENIAAVGDSLNDIEIIGLVGQGIAMGNAHDEVKKIASQIIGANDEDGLAIWLESLI